MGGEESLTVVLGCVVVPNSLLGGCATFCVANICDAELSVSPEETDEIGGCAGTLTSRAGDTLFVKGTVDVVMFGVAISVDGTVERTNGSGVAGAHEDTSVTTGGCAEWIAMFSSASTTSSVLVLPTRSVE